MFLLLFYLYLSSFIYESNSYFTIVDLNYIYTILLYIIYGYFLKILNIVYILLYLYINIYN